MSNKMLIDASHPEETRVVVVRGNRIEEFDFESEHKKQLKGNIYLARVTRVEPSLQAAFVEYGGNRHGFLAFSEIHPDYYQIPVADRLALLEEEEKAAIDENDADDLAAEKSQKKKRSKKSKKDKSDETIAAAHETEVVSEALENDEHDDTDHHDDNGEDSVEMVGAEDALEEVPTHQRTQRRQYKIQEVIKRRQILLVQVVKEERGNKGAALTTYLSLAGRYSVLMPNTARGGGISRKITNIQDRKRLKDIVKDLDVPKGMGVILRTAGANRTKAEVKRDYEYLMRLWENVRNLTLESVAPSLVYEEGSLIKRSIRDLYNKDIGEILVAGDQGYREAKDFMRMLMPSHAKVVQPYRDPFPIFARNGIETQLDRMLQPQVTLKSGGYLVINQTEALVAIDVNSGRSTKEHSIEETAYQTNLEAAEEVARQLRLRDLAGLVVIDFIDMEEKRNIRVVEKKLKDCLKDDRARIQVGRISHFGLMEMSRQRIRASVLESTMQPCPHCGGTGHIRSDSSVALHVIRSIEEYLLRNPQFNIIVRTPVATALYVLNHKRQVLGDLELRFGLTISIEADDAVGAQHLAIYKGTPAEGTPMAPPPLPPVEEELEEETIETVVDEIEEESPADNSQRRRRRRRGKRSDRDDDQNQRVNATDDDQGDEDSRRRRRRGRRGGRRNRDSDFDRRRIPYAEPVGEFAEQALAEIKAARRQRRVPAAEPVGFSGNENPNNAVNPVVAEQTRQEEIQTESVKPQARRQRKKRGENSKVSSAEIDSNEKSDDVVAESVVENAETVKPVRKRGRKPKAEKLPEAESMNAIASSSIAETEKPEASVTAEEKKPVKRTRKKAVKAEAVEIAEEVQISSPKEEVIEPKPSRSRRKVVTNTEPSEPVVTSSETIEEEKPKRAGWWQRKGFF